MDLDHAGEVYDQKEQTMGFYQTFTTMIAQYQQSKAEDESLDDPAALTLVKREQSKTAPTPETIISLAPSLIRSMVKPQRLIQNDPDYYIAADLRTNTYYICYRNLMMIDIDFYKVSVHSSEQDKVQVDSPDYQSTINKRLEFLLDLAEDYALLKGLRFRVYRSRNGIHLFLISRSADRKNLADLQVMLDLDCDFYYTVYSYLRGWSVRLNRKLKEETMSYQYLRDLGDEKPIEHLEKLVDLHLRLVEVFRGVEPSSMFGI